MNIKGVMLASAAALVMASPAFAADAVVEQAPVAANYVKVCDTFGAGYFYIPGQDYCLKISGRIRVTGTYTTSNKGGADQTKIDTDGRVDFNIAQATDFGRSEAAIRFQKSSGSTTAGVGMAYITVGDFSVGYAIKDTTIFDQESFGVNTMLLNANAKGGSMTAGGNLGDNGTGARINHNFGGGVSAALGVTGAGSSSQWLVSSNTTAPQKAVVQGSLTYSSGAIKSVTLAGSYDSTKSSSGGGYGVVLVGKYGLTSALDVMGGVGYTHTMSKNWTNLLIGAQYTFNPKVSAWADFGYTIKEGTSNGVYGNLGAQYNITPTLYVQAEEQYLKETSTSWTTLLRLRRNF